MKAWRIVLRKFGRTSRAAFGGLSGFLVDGRWHTAGRHLDYAAQNLSLAILERLVHYKRFDALEPHLVYVLDVPDTAIESAPAPPHGWDGDELLPAAQATGDSWCDERGSPALRVPSAVTPGEYNLIINSRHPDWQWKWVISGPVTFAFDARLAELMERSQKPTASLMHQNPALSLKSCAAVRRLDTRWCSRGKRIPTAGTGAIWRESCRPGSTEADAWLAAQIDRKHDDEAQ